jgi:hypothetical protein
VTVLFSVLGECHDPKTGRSAKADAEVLVERNNLTKQHINILHRYNLDIIRGGGQDRSG